MAITSISDALYALRFLRLLTTPWKDTNAYKKGIIDDKGKLLRKPETSEEKAVYNIFHKLVFNIKRLVGKNQNLGSYAAALFLIKENMNLSEDELTEALEELGFNVNSQELEESWIQNGETLLPGSYKLLDDFASPKTGDIIARKGTRINVSEASEPVDMIFGAYIYEVTHIPTKQKIYVTAGDLNR